MKDVRLEERFRGLYEAGSSSYRPRTFWHDGATRHPTLATITCALVGSGSAMKTQDFQMLQRLQGWLQSPSRTNES
jgi:hypothetical protein